MSLHGIALGDMHLDKLEKHFPERSIALQLNEYRKAFRYAERHGIRRAFLLGDIGEGYKDFTGFLRMSEAAQSALFKFLKELDGQFEVFVYPGNHDSSTCDSHTLQFFFELQRHKVFKTVRFFERETALTLGGVPVSILPYPITKPKAKVPNLCFAHYEVRGSLQDNGRVIKGAEKHSYGDHRFIQGHLHTRQKIRKQHYYPGTLYQTSFGESLPKGFMEFKASVDGRGRLDLRSKFVDNDPQFKLINLKVRKRSDLKEIESNPLYRYKLFVAEEIRLTEDDLKGHENIVNRLSFSDEKELEALEYSEFMLDSQQVDLSYDKVLEEYLTTTKKFDARQLSRCKALLESRKQGAKHAHR